jgi:hypothetical protein
MAALYKINEFYTCAERFCFLAKCYRPENLPDDVNISLDVFCKFVEENKDFKIRSEDATDYFNSFYEFREKRKMQEMLDYIIKKYAREHD